MKTASGVIALVLGILTVLNVGGCVKAEHDYSQFEAYQNSAAGTAENFARGFQSGSQGDLFGATLNLVDQERGLGEAVRSARNSAWLCLIGTGIALTVSLFTAAPRKTAATAPIPETRTTSNRSIRKPRPEAAAKVAPSVEQRLRALEQLRVAQLISADEYEASMRRILDAI